MPAKTTSFRRLCLVGGLAVVISTAVNLIIRGIAVIWLKISPQFGPIGIGPVIFWSVVSGIGAILVFYLVTRRASRPLPMYVLIAFIVYLCTFIPDALLLSRNPPIFPGTTAAAVLVLMSMHAAEAAIMILTLILAGIPKATVEPLQR